MKNRLGIKNGSLSPCPASPNCVSSDAADATHRIEPFYLAASPAAAWEALKKEVAARPGTRIVTAAEDYLHAVEKSRIFGFVDDIEFHLKKAQGIVAVRSASRVGKYDLGVNRKRLEQIRRALKRQGIVK